MASAIYTAEGQAYVYANVKSEAFRPMMNLSDTIAFAQSGPDGDVVLNWRSEQCNWVQKLSRRLQEAQR
ncbi:hypothetical protein MTO96_040867 [Rhipicephalus appendiculatus]